MAYYNFLSPGIEEPLGRKGWTKKLLFVFTIHVLLGRFEHSSTQSGFKWTSATRGFIKPYKPTVFDWDAPVWVAIIFLAYLNKQWFINPGWTFKKEIVHRTSESIQKKRMIIQWKSHRNESWTSTWQFFFDLFGMVSSRDPNSKVGKVTSNDRG